ASVDGLVAIDVLEHLTRNELVRLACEVHRTLRPGGRLLVQIPNGEALRPGPVWAGDLTHETLLSAGSLAQLLAPVGMQMVNVWGVTPGYCKVSRAVRTLLWKSLTLGPWLVDVIESVRAPRV